MKENKAGSEARLRILPEADPEWSFCTRMGNLTFDENENSAAWIVAQTRLGTESLTVIPLERRGDEAKVWPEGPDVRLNEKASLHMQKDILKYSLRLNNRQAIETLKSGNDRLPKLFSESNLLQHCAPLWLVNGNAHIQTSKAMLNLKLDPRLGLVVSKEGD
jgi:hypothetical protein